MLSWALGGLVFLLYAAALYVALGRPQAADESFAARVVAAACFAPSAAAWVLGVCWRVSPGLSVSATLAVLALIPAVLVALALARRRKGLASAVRSFGGLLEPPQVFVLSLLLAATVYLVMRIPPYSNDPLEYAAVAQLLHDTRSLAFYPVLDTSASGGLYAPWTHPPGFPLLIALVMLIVDTDAGSALKVVAALHVVLGIAGLAMLLPSRMRLIATLSLVATPAYLLGVINGYVEVVRLTELIGVLAACLVLCRAPAVASAMRLGLLFGLCGFVHSLGIVSLAFFLPGLLLLRQGAPVARLGWAAGIVATQLLMLSPDLWLNLSNFGVLLGDRPAVWQIPEIGRAEYFREFRSLSSPADIVVSGLLQGFSQPSHFGVSYWLPAALVVWALLHGPARAVAWPDVKAVARVSANWPPEVLLSVGVIGAFYLMALSLALLGSVEAIKNPRYLLTLQPFVAIVTARLALGLPWAELMRPILIGGLLCCSLIPAVYMHERYPGLLAGTQTRHEAYFAHVHPEADAVLAVNRLTRGERCPLLFKQADYAVYGRHCYWSYLDHRFSDVYRARTAAAAAERLRLHGVAVIMTPNYAMPEIYNTAFAGLLADPGAARLRWAEDGYAVFDLLTPSLEPTKIVKAGHTVPPAEALSSITVDWAQLATNRPAVPEAELVGVLCIQAAGRGRIEVKTIDPQSSRDPGRILRAVRGEGRFVMAAAIVQRRNICAQQLPGHTRGRLQVQTTASARAERIEFSWVQLPATAAKDN
jgi:hypothetical protein